MTQHKRLAFFALIIGLFSGLAQAESPLKKDEISLNPDEGFLLIALNTDTLIDSMKLRTGLKASTVDLIKDVEPGETTYYLYRVKAGDYDIDHVFPDHGTNRVYFRMGYDVSEMTIVAGQVNYHGTVIMRIPEWVGRGRFYRHNRSTQALAWLQSEFPKISSRFEFAFVGETPDDFSDYLKSLKTSPEISP